MDEKKFRLNNTDFMPDPKKYQPSHAEVTIPGIVNKTLEEKAAREAREEEYWKASISALESIKDNTAILVDVKKLLQDNNENHDQILALIMEILEILKSTSKEEAEGKFTAVMKKITTVSDGINGAASLFTMAQTVFTFFKAMF